MTEEDIIDVLSVLTLAGGMCLVVLIQDMSEVMQKICSSCNEQRTTMKENI